MKRKVIVDLDVTTLAFWDKKDEAKLLEKVRKGAFYMITPYIILEHLSKWKHRKLAEEIARFYEVYSSEIITAQNIINKTDEIGTDFKKLLLELISIRVKEEDAVLVIVSGIFEADYLVTFNRKHLKNNETKINEVLKKNEIKAIRIVLPSEL